MEEKLKRDMKRNNRKKRGADDKEEEKLVEKLERRKLRMQFNLKSRAEGASIGRREKKAKQPRFR